MNGGVLNAGDVSLRLFFSLVAGGAIGLNRFLHHKPAGLGTHALVSLGAALATVTAARGGDPTTLSRVIGGLVTGVGFIGAGVIIRASASQEVHGLTTAASIWTAAILGIACGAADYAVGAIGLAFALGILVLGKPCEDLAVRVFGHRDDEQNTQPEK